MPNDSRIIRPVAGQVLSASQMRHIIESADSNASRLSPGMVGSTGPGGVTAWKRTFQSIATPANFSVIPATCVRGYTANPDGADWRRFYIRYGMLNGVAVKGTLAADGTIGGESTLITVPDSTAKFVVWAAFNVRLTGIPTASGGANCTIDFDIQGVPEIGSAANGWTGYPCQPAPMRGPDLAPWTGKCYAPFQYVAQTAYFPIAIINTVATATRRYTITPGIQQNSDLILYYLGSSNNRPPAVKVAWGLSSHLEEYDYISQCHTACDPNDCTDPDGGLGGDNLPDEYVDPDNPFTRDQLYRAFGSWLYRLYRPPNPGHADPTNWRTVAMQDGLLFTGSGEAGEGDPIVVSWEGAVVPTGVTDADPFLVVLKVEFSNLCGLSESETGPQFTASVISGLESALTLTPTLTDTSTTPTDWPSGKTVSNLDSGTLYMIIGSITTDAGVMVITEHFRDQASFVLAVQGGDDGVTATGGLLIPKHVPHLVCGRAENAIAALLGDTCFDDKTAVADVKVVLDASATPTLTYKVQKKLLTRYYYMGALAYSVDGSWEDSAGDTIAGWDCD